MIFTESKLPGAFIIEVEKRSDERGFFARSWCAREFEAHGLCTQMVQSNISFNHRKGTLRGMHFQKPPYGEAKLIRCTRGAIYDVIIDLRPQSPTYKQWLGVELTADNYAMLYVPENFAHGFQTLTDAAEVFYQISQYYTPGAEGGLRWDDPAFNIQWPQAQPSVIAEKDKQWPLFRDVREKAL